MDDEAARDVHDGLDFGQPILPERLPALHQIHDLIGEIGHSAELDRAPERDDVGIDALRDVMSAGETGVFRRHPQGHAPPESSRPVVGLCDDESARADPEVDGLVQIARVLLEGVGTGDADVRDAVLDVGGHVDRLHEERAISVGQLDHQTAIVGPTHAVERDPGAREQLRCGDEDAPLRQRDRERLGHEVRPA
jgi:hypothetical protein